MREHHGVLDTVSVWRERRRRSLELQWLLLVHRFNRIVRDFDVHADVVRHADGLNRREPVVNTEPTDFQTDARAERGDGIKHSRLYLPHVVDIGGPDPQHVAAPLLQPERI